MFARRLRSAPTVPCAQTLMVCRRALALGVMAQLVLSAPVAGDGERVVLSLSFDPAAVAVPVDARTLRSTPAAVRGMASVLRQSFGLVVPDDLTVYVYAGRRAFERGLVHDGRLAPIRAAELSEFAVGIGRSRQLLLNEDIPGRTEREWLRLIAHELTHLAQIDLAGGEGRGEQWLAEGMAEWVAFAALERLELDTLDHRRAAALAGIAEHAELVRAGLDLEAHGTPRGFYLWHRHRGTRPTYQLAFLMADALIAQHGFARLTGYFASFAESRDRRRNFRRAFGETLPGFETTVLARLAAASLDGPAGRLPSSDAP